MMMGGKGGRVREGKMVSKVGGWKIGRVGK